MSKRETEARRVAEALEAHDRLDTERFDALTATLNRVDANVQSLLETRASWRGIWKTVVVISTAVSTITGLFLAWLNAKP